MYQKLGPNTLKSIENNQKTDAEILWEDAKDRLYNAGISDQILTMVQTCSVCDFSDSTLVISTESGFAHRILEREHKLIEMAVSEAAFQPMDVKILYNKDPLSSSTYSPKSIDNSTSYPDGSKTSMTVEELMRYRNQNSYTSGQKSDNNSKTKNPLIEEIAVKDALLTFDTFVEAEENRFALAAAKQVANGTTDQFNPLFIHGGSGLGKTHLLRAIQNYIAQNDPERTCVYRVAKDFIGDYTAAMGSQDQSVKDALLTNYYGVDVLILDDVQHLRGATKTIEFFFEAFNHLTSHGKQIVLAADVPPSQLGLDERYTSRMQSGSLVSVQTPTPEFKKILIKTFYDRMKSDNVLGCEGTLTKDDINLMVEKSGNNIREIRAFVQDCLIRATQLEKMGQKLDETDITTAAQVRWAKEGRRVSVNDVQSLIQTHFGISHADLIGTKRNKEIAYARHIGIWLARELTDNTLMEIGEKFGGRTHATVKHSIGYIDNLIKEDRLTYDTVHTLKNRLGGR